jgi:Fe2+ transport system protein FeoA
MTLDKLTVGKESSIINVGGTGPLRCRLLDMGLIPRTKVKIVKIAPMGDPIEIRLRGYELTLRIEDAQKIEVEDSSGKVVEKYERSNVKPEI